MKIDPEVSSGKLHENNTVYNEKVKRDSLLDGKSGGK